MKRGGLKLAAGRVRSKFGEKKINKESRKMPPHPELTTKSTATRRPRPPRDDAQRNTSHALPILARFHRSRVCENRPRPAPAISKNDECYTYTDIHTTDRQTDRQTERHVEDRRLDYHLSKQRSVALNGSLLYELVVLAAITLLRNEKVVPLGSGNSPTIRTYVLVR